MNSNIPIGYHQIERHDGIFQERVHDTYKSQKKLVEPTACPQCNAVFHKGRWQWQAVPKNAHQELCPACHRIKDHFPAGFVRLSGDFFLAHKDEILHLARHLEEKERAEHPLQRIMNIEQESNGVMVTTTDIHLARGIGEALHDAYQGELEYHYNPGENLLRVHWVR